MNYTVRKNRYNRYAFRFVGLIFIIVGLVSIIAFKANVASGNRAYATITLLLVVVCVLYGIYLIKSTFRITSYDIKYSFQDNNIIMETKRGEKILDYSDIEDIGYVIPNPDIDYVIVQSKTKKIQHVLGFMNNAEYGKKIYDYLDARVNVDEE